MCSWIMMRSSLKHCKINNENHTIVVPAVNTHTNTERSEYNSSHVVVGWPFEVWQCSKAGTNYNFLFGAEGRGSDIWSFLLHRKGKKSHVKMDIWMGGRGENFLPCCGEEKKRCKTAWKRERNDTLLDSHKWLSNTSAVSYTLHWCIWSSWRCSEVSMWSSNHLSQLWWQIMCGELEKYVWWFEGVK